MNKIFSYLLIIMTFIIVQPLISFGQSSLVGNLLEIKYNPENPEPLQNVLVTVSSLSYNMDSSKITWIVNGVEKKTEIGLKEFNVAASNSGQKTTVKAVVSTPEDGVKSIETSFTPATVDLIYESLSYVPPFYKGRALNPKQGSVLVSAIPELVRSNGDKIANNNIIYTWKKDGNVQQSSSGVGKNVFVYSGSIPARDVTIDVMASSLDGIFSAKKQTIIKNNDPEVIFYEDSPIYGLIMGKAITNTVRMVTDEFKVKAFPFFMSVGYAQNPDLNYNWVIDGNPSENLNGDKTSMIFRQEKKGAGITNVGLKIDSISRIFQSAENNFSINFEKQ